MPDDAPQLPYPTQIQVSALTQVPWLFKVGEVYGAPRSNAFQGMKRGVPNGHVCGDEKDFTTGGSYDPDAPPVVYDEQGLPLCCHGPAVLKMGPQVRLELPEPIPPESLNETCSSGIFGPMLVIGDWTTVLCPQSDYLIDPRDTWGWARFDPAALVPTVYALELSAPLPADMLVRVYQPNCGAGTGFGFINIGPGQHCASGTWNASGVILLKVENTTGADVVLTMRLRPGIC